MTTPPDRNRVLVTTQWVQEHVNDPSVRIVEIDVDTKAYDAGHIRGAVGWNWQTQLQDRVRRDIVGREAFAALLGASGIAPSHTIVLYGDNNNWFAAYGFWLLKLYGHEDVRLMDGGRVKWLNEDDKELTVEPPAVTPTTYNIQVERQELRARVTDVLGVVQAKSQGLVDVRSPAEFTGEVIAPPGMSETAQRGGHIPGARSIPWSTAVAADGTFKNDAELRHAYVTSGGVDLSRPVIAYCRIGERSSHTWFVLKYLLGVENVRNYDGSWTEYGNLVAAPIELGAPAPAAG
ncbi:MAG: sulfurtransferase [Gemmatimonadaceae bacterium]|nr:sulfurtransferase [Gemmatimonadaceae bacterium]